jgi:hypothetical protein
MPNIWQFMTTLQKIISHNIHALSLVMSYLVVLWVTVYETYVGAKVCLILKNGRCPNCYEFCVS